MVVVRIMMMIIVSYVVVMRVVVVNVRIRMVRQVITATGWGRRRRLTVVVIWWVGPHDTTEVETNLQDVFNATRLDQL